MMLNQPPQNQNSYSEAERLMDLLFLEFDDYEQLYLNTIIKNSKLNEDEKILAKNLVRKIEILMYDKYFYAAKAEPSDYYGYLTPFGREVKSYGGHFAYIKSQNEVQQIELRKSIIDLKTKEFIYKARYVPYILSLFALIISLLAYFKEDKKEKVEQFQKKEMIKTIPKNGIKFHTDNLIKNDHK